MSGSIKTARAMNTGRAMPGTGYRGDPGLFGFLGKVASTIGGVASSFIPGGGIVRQAVKKASSILGSKGRGRAPIRGPGPMPFGTGRSAVGRVLGGIKFGHEEPVPGLIGLGQRLIPGGATGFKEPEIGSPTGYHVNKSSYFLKSGEYIPAGTRWVKNRKRNPLNPRAWDRAYGRLKSANNFKKRMAKISFRATC